MSGLRYWAPDLGRDIGSTRWFAELVLLLGLLGLVIPFCPGPNLTLLSQSDAASLKPSRSSSLQRTATTAVAHEPVTADIHLTTKSGQPLQQLLVHAGARGDQARMADRLVSAALFPKELEPGTQVSVRLAPSIGKGWRATRIAMRPRLDLALVLDSQSDGSMTLKRSAIAVETTTERVRGRVRGKLGDDIVKAGGSPAIADAYGQAMKDRSGSPDAGVPGDSFDLITTVRRAADGRVELGELLYAALWHDDKPLAEVLRWGNEGRYETAKIIDRAQGGAIMWPVNGRFTSGFGVRFHPILGYARMHAGIDISSPSGTPIYAASNATVVFAGWHGGHGNYIRLDQADGQGTGYAHLSRIAVTSGETVTSGQVIGYVGSTGLSTGPHLHYEVYRNGRTVDPLTARFGRAPSDSDDRRFQTVVAALKTLSPIVAHRRFSNGPTFR